MQYKIIKYNDAIDIVDKDGFLLYHLNSEMLQELSIIDGSNCPDCIIQMASANIVPISVLYKIAFYIQNNFPYLHINWFTTFFHVEKENYIRTAFAFKNMLEGNVAESDEEKQYQLAEFEENEPLDNADTIILKIVMMNIINFNVIIR